MQKFTVVIVFFCSISLFLICSTTSHAHGVRGKVGAGGIVIIAEYDTGEPMSYAKVSIFAPNSKLIFQSGRTDRNGRFCFFPDTPGKWRVIVDDEIGHRLELNISIDKKMKIKENLVEQNPLPIPIRALIGISFIFGIFGIFFWWKRRKT